MIESLLIAAASRNRRLATLRDLDDLPEREEMMQLLELVGTRAPPRQKVIVLPEGKRKLVDIAMALALKPKLVLMDEPTSGVASAEKFAIMDVLVAALNAQARHLGLRRARHGSGPAICRPRRRLEQRQDPDRRPAAAEVLADPAVIGQVIGI